MTLSSNWQTKTIGEVAEIVNGGTPKTSSSDYWDGGLMWITPKDMGKLKSAYVDQTSRTISESGLKNSSAKLLPVNSIILSSRAPIGHLAINTVPMATNQGCKGLVPKDGINAKFLYYFLKNSVDLLNSLGSGATFKELSSTKLKEVHIKAPPIQEQIRIVKLLEEAFESIDRARAVAEKNLQNSKGIFESYLQSVFNNPDDSWENKKLGDKELFQIIDGDRGKNYPKKTDFSSDDYCLFLNTKNVRPNGFDFQSKIFITQEKDEKMGNGKLQRNDVLLTTRGTIGNTAVYNDKVEFDNVRINSGMLIFRPNTKLITPDYLFAIFQSGIMKLQIKKYFSGAAQPQLPIKTLINFTIPVPNSKNIQEQIVDKLASLRTKTEKLESTYQQKITTLEELKKSLLNQAFSGNL